jgi:hypothetical protein
MVPPNSNGASPTPPYSGTCSHSYSFRLQDSHLVSRPFPWSSARKSDMLCYRPYNPQPAVTGRVWALARSLATTCAIIIIFSSSPYLDVSVQEVGSLCSVIVQRLLGCPIRIPMDHSSCAANHGFSQLDASFLAARSLGIPHAPLVTFIALYVCIGVFLQVLCRITLLYSLCYCSWLYC